jgi:hypothetical protein
MGVQKGVNEMTNAITDPRHLVLSIAGALMTSLLFVSAATSLPLA